MLLWSIVHFDGTCHDFLLKLCIQPDLMSKIQSLFNVIKRLILRNSINLIQYQMITDFIGKILIVPKNVSSVVWFMIWSHFSFILGKKMSNLNAIISKLSDFSAGNCAICLVNALSIEVYSLFNDILPFQWSHH